jgi:membrane-bound inhibitor of C-type lysozyme
MRAEIEGRWADAVQYYQVTLLDETNLLKRKSIISSITRCLDLSDKNYSVIRMILNNELQNSSGWYKSFLYFMQSDLLFREGKYNEAIACHLSRADVYRGTAFESEMLSRVAHIYGGYLGDKELAKEYADRAAQSNPGLASLRIAYEASGNRYNPSLYEDKYHLIYELFDVNQPDNQTNIKEFLTLYPNPANPVTTIMYSIKIPSHVKLTIYSINGQKVTTLIDGPMNAGAHSVSFGGVKYASGTYFYRFESDSFKKSGKILLLK